MVCVHMCALGFTGNCDPSNVDAVNESPDLFKSNKHSTISPTFLILIFIVLRNCITVQSRLASFGWDLSCFAL